MTGLGIGLSSSDDDELDAAAAATAPFGAALGDLGTETDAPFTFVPAFGLGDPGPATAPDAATTAPFGATPDCGAPIDLL